ncbi:hypothetical protein GCM10011365_03010 [Marinicella pacifica]|uniref:Uncharacterized protein n=1 Tax=Marinicella pacifica TaxID=1171543 RepID=A0A917CE59_9GAMM|nr:hypothetical protein GCM10011365_03010 [Marinicella pacifica]
MRLKPTLLADILAYFYKASLEFSNGIKKSYFTYFVLIIYIKNTRGAFGLIIVS